MLDSIESRIVLDSIESRIVLDSIVTDSAG